MIRTLVCPRRTGADLESETPIRMKMKNLRKTIRGRLLAGAPRDQLERNMWEAMGYRLLQTGDWYEPQAPVGPSAEFVRRYPYGQVCKACRDNFRSTKYPDAFLSVLPQYHGGSQEGY